MKTRIILSVALAASTLIASLAVAQDIQPLVTEVPTSEAGGIGIIGTLPPPPDVATLPPAPESSSDLNVAQSEAVPVLLAARSDLELIATEAIGNTQRPVGWNGSVDTNNPDLGIQIRLDLELMAASRWGDVRPPEWFGVVTSVPLAIARDIRHDLELLADEVMGVSTLRPSGWQGDKPVYRCSRATQSLLILLESQDMVITVDPSQANFCLNAEIDASIYIEQTILQPPSEEALTTATSSAYPYSVNNAYTVAFLDRDASNKIGVLPESTGFTALGRSTIGFSNMTLIEGDGFRIYVDWTTTPLTLDEFNALPDFDTVSADIFCEATWCGVGL